MRIRFGRSLIERGLAHLRSRADDADHRPRAGNSTRKQIEEEETHDAIEHP